MCIADFREEAMCEVWPDRQSQSDQWTDVLKVKDGECICLCQWTKMYAVTPSLDLTLTFDLDLDLDLDLALFQGRVHAGALPYSAHLR